MKYLFFALLLAACGKPQSQLSPVGGWSRDMANGMEVVDIRNTGKAVHYTCPTRTNCLESFTSDWSASDSSFTECSQSGCTTSNLEFSGDTLKIGTIAYTKFDLP